MPQYILHACVCGYVGFPKQPRSQYLNNTYAALIQKPSAVALLDDGMLQARRNNQLDPLNLRPSQIHRGEFVSPQNNLCISSVHSLRDSSQVLKGYQVSAVLFEKKVREWSNKLTILSNQVIYCFKLDVIVSDPNADRLVDNKFTADIRNFSKLLVKYKFLVDSDAPIMWNMTPSLRKDVVSLIRADFIKLEKIVHTLDDQFEKLKLVIDDTVEKAEANKRAQRNRADLESSRQAYAASQQANNTLADNTPRGSLTQPPSGPAAWRADNISRANAFRDAVHAAAARSTNPSANHTHNSSPPAPVPSTQASARSINAAAPVFVPSSMAYPAPVYNPHPKSDYDQVTPTLMPVTPADTTPTKSISRQQTPVNDFLTSSFDQLENEIADNMFTYHILDI